MRKGYRPERIGVEIKKIISELLLREVKDPLLTTGMVSITDVEVTRDGSYAKVFLSVFGGEEGDALAEENVLTGMERAKGLFKREIGARMDLRRVPDLIFEIDTSLAYGRHMDALIDEVVKKDEEE